MLPFNRTTRKEDWRSYVLFDFLFLIERVIICKCLFFRFAEVWVPWGYAWGPRFRPILAVPSLCTQRRLQEINYVRKRAPSAGHVWRGNGGRWDHSDLRWAGTGAKLVSKPDDNYYRILNLRRGLPSFNLQLLIVTYFILYSSLIILIDDFIVITSISWTILSYDLIKPILL